MYEQILSCVAIVSSRLAGDLVRVGVQETYPTQIFDLRELFEQQRKAIFQSEVFAVAGRVLSDERDFAYACLRKLLRLRP